MDEWKSMVEAFKRGGPGAIKREPQDASRIARILDKLGKLWDNDPNLKFGQFVVEITGGQWLSPSRMQTMSDADFEKILDERLARKVMQSQSAQDRPPVPMPRMPGMMGGSTPTDV